MACTMASRCVGRGAQGFRQFSAAESALRFVASAALCSAATQWGAERLSIAAPLESRHRASSFAASTNARRRQHHGPTSLAAEIRSARGNAD